MEPRDIVFGLHELEGIGWQSILRLIAGVQPLERLFIMKEHDLTGLGLRAAQAATVRERLTPAFVERRREAYRERGVRIVTVYDNVYPDILKHTAFPPWVLYGIGDWAKLECPAIGIVGTRTPTVYGKKVAVELAGNLARAGFAIVSGLARGIDGCAHQGALDAGGATIAVLGCPIDRVYPPDNAALHRDIARRGLILSEYPIGTAMKKGMFPMRNRIIAGLSRGVVIVEAARESGSLLTAAQALDENRDVFAVPGPITSPKSVGVLNLVRDGAAKIVLSAEHIIEEYRHLITKPLPAHSKQGGHAAVMSADERRVYDLLAAEAVTADELMAHTEFTFGHLHSVLLSLTMKNLIQPLPGSAYKIR
jgi:DNA processing protein